MTTTTTTNNTPPPPAHSIDELGASADEFNLKMEDRRRMRALAYAQVFGSRFGRMVLDDLMQVAGWHMGVEASIFYDNASHAQMAFREGQKELVRHILRRLPVEAGQNNNKDNRGESAQ